MIAWLTAALAALAFAPAPSAPAAPHAHAHHHDGDVTCDAAKKYRCTICQNVYDPAVGDPQSGIAPGTSFENLPDTWSCPECGAQKTDFEQVQD